MSGQQQVSSKSRVTSSAGTLSGGGRTLGALGAAGAVLALGIAPVVVAPVANADIDALLQPVVDAIVQTDPGPAPDIGAVLVPALAAEPLWIDGSLHQTVDSLLNSASVALTGQALIDHGVPAGSIAGLEAWLFGDGATAAPWAAAATNLPPHSVPLEVRAFTDPVVGLSVNGGRPIEAVADTGSESLAVPWYYLGLAQFPIPVGFGITGYTGGLDYLYATIRVPVDFGDGLVTAPTDVHAVLLTWPQSLQNIFDPTYWSLEAFQKQSDAQAILGLGQNATDELGSPVTMALPGELNQGVLINQPGGYLQFGPDPLDPATSIALAGAPYSTVQVSINGGELHTVQAAIDTGGLYGSIPASVVDTASNAASLPAGTLVSVYTGGSDPTLLYSYTTTATNTLEIDHDSTDMNTGDIPFWPRPIYIGNNPVGVGMTIFGNMPR